jgi:hypothetical protein
VPQHGETEHTGRIVNTPASYSGDPGFKSLPVDRLPDWRLSWFTPVPPGKCWNSTLNQATTASFHILPNSSFTYRPFIRSYIVRVTEIAQLNELQTNNTRQRGEDWGTLTWYSCRKCTYGSVCCAESRTPFIDTQFELFLPTSLRVNTQVTCIRVRGGVNSWGVCLLKQVVPGGGTWRPGRLQASRFLVNNEFLPFLPFLFLTQGTNLKIWEAQISFIEKSFKPWIRPFSTFILVFFWGSGGFYNATNSHTLHRFVHYIMSEDFSHTCN